MTFVEPASDGFGPASDAFGLSEQPDKQASPPMNAARVDQCSGLYCMIPGTLSENACLVNYTTTPDARPHLRTSGNLGLEAVRRCRVEARGRRLPTEAPEVSPRGRTGPNSDAHRGPSGLISRLKAEMALSAGERRTGRPRRSRRRLRFSRVARLAVAAAQDAATPERWPTGRRRARRSRVGQGRAVRILQRLGSGRGPMGRSPEGRPGRRGLAAALREGLRRDLSDSPAGVPRGESDCPSPDRSGFLSGR